MVFGLRENEGKWWKERNGDGQEKKMGKKKMGGVSWEEEEPCYLFSRRKKF